MLTKWFGTRSSPSLKKDHSFRPWLEKLEERNAPGGWGHGGGDNNNDQGDDHDHDHHPPPPAASVNNSIGGNINAHGSFNNDTITGSFDNTINSTVNITLNPAQSSAVLGLLGISGFMSSALSNPNLGTLVNDEIALAVDNYLTTPMVASSLGLSATTVSTLKSDAATLSAAIAANPVEGTLFGQVVGTVAYGVTLHALTSAQPKM